MRSYWVGNFDMLSSGVRSFRLSIIVQTLNTYNNLFQTTKPKRSKTHRSDSDNDFECGGCKKQWDENVSDEWAECEGCAEWICEACLPENFDAGASFYCDKCAQYTDLDV
jgi:hypothetical protein